MGKRGPKPGMGGRPKSPISEKIANGNPGKRPLTVLDFKNSASDLEGKPMPKPSEYLSAEQKNGTQFFAVEIYECSIIAHPGRKCKSGRERFFGG